MFNKRQKSCVKHIHLVTDNGLLRRKAFYKLKVAFFHALWMIVNLSIDNKGFLKRISPTFPSKSNQKENSTKFKMKTIYQMI